MDVRQNFLNRKIIFAFLHLSGVVTSGEFFFIIGRLGTTYSQASFSGFTALPNFEMAVRRVWGLYATMKS